MMGVDIKAFYPSDLSSHLSRAALQMIVYVMTSLRMGMSVQTKVIAYLGNIDLLRDSCTLILSFTETTLQLCILNKIPLLFTR